MKTNQIAIIGAGPTGIEAALYAVQLGYEPVIYERAASLSTVIASRGHQRSYASWRFLTSPLGRSCLQNAESTWVLDKLETSPTIGEYYERYLEPLASLSQLANRIRYDRKVVALARSGLRKGDLIGSPSRADYPFRLLIEDAHGAEQEALADFVIDASGVYDLPIPLAQGAAIARHERALASRIFDVMQIDSQWLRNHASGKTILLVGESLEGLDLANALVDLASAAPGTRLIWSFLREAEWPFSRNTQDPIPARQAAVERLHQALAAATTVQCLSGVSITKLERSTDGNWSVGVAGHSGPQTIHADIVIANTGYRPDSTLYQDLQFHQCYASDAPMALAAAMLQAAPQALEIATSLGAATLKNPEPNFYVLGRKSYGRSEGYVPSIGMGQIAELFAAMKEQPNLDLYAALDPTAPRFTKSAPPPVRRAPTPQRLTDSEQQYKALIEHIQEVVFQTDIQHRIVYLSPSWTAMTGLHEEPYYGRSWMELLHPDDRDAGLSQCNLFVGREMDEYHEEFRVLTHDGTVRWCEINASALINLDGKAYGTIGTMVDITDRRAIQAELREAATYAEQQLAALESAHHEMERVNQQLSETIAQQEHLISTIRDLSAPLLPVHDEILVLPLIGHIDSARSAQITETLLHGVQRHRARFVIIDITGVSVVDTSVANHLMQATKAIGLLGTRCVLVGIGQEVARTIVQLGIDLSALTTRSNLRAGIEYAMVADRQRLGARHTPR